MRKKSEQLASSPDLILDTTGGGVQFTDRLEKPSHRRKRLNQYLRGDRIGKGRHGEVYLCYDTLHDNREVAVKLVKRNSPKDKIKLLRKTYQQASGSSKYAITSTENSVRREIAVMKECRHPNLAALLEVIDDHREDKIYLVMEYLGGGSVEWATEDHEPLLTLAQTRRIMRDVILGLEFLHSKGILHRDVKPSNIVYTADRSSVKLIDFGISHITVPSSKRSRTDPAAVELHLLFPEIDLLKRIGTPSFLAPEVVWFSDDSEKEQATASEYGFPPTSFHDASATVVAQSFPMPKVRPPITTAIDIWSLGVTFYCLLFGHTPFTGSSSENDSVQHSEFMLYRQICTQDWTPEEFMGAERVYADGRHPPDKSSDGFIVIRLLDSMLQKHPWDRISLLQVKKNPFILRDVLNSKDWLRLTATAEADPGACWVKAAARKFMNVLSRKDSL